MTSVNGNSIVEPRYAYKTESAEETNRKIIISKPGSGYTGSHGVHAGYVCGRNKYMSA